MTLPPDRPDFITRRVMALHALQTLGNADPSQLREMFSLPPGREDQAQAASRETRGWQEQVVDHLGGSGVELDPRSLRALTAMASVFAAMGDGHHWEFCAHLRRTPAQPSFILLALRRIVCQRCMGTKHMPPTADADRCDLCGERGISKFWPFSVNWANALVVGDICGRCAELIGAKATPRIHH